MIKIPGPKRILITMLVAGMVLTGCVKKTEGEAETSAASATDQKEEVNENIIDEGDDTPIEITKYSKYTGPNHENFLRPGDKIAVISPSALPTQEQTDATVKGLKAWGYVPVEGKYVCPEVRTLENCCEDLEWALTDPEIKGIFCVRGGFASCEVMEAIDRDLIKKAKKPIIGFSDISACHSAWTVQGLPSIHASMSGAFTSLPEECVEVEKRMLQGEVPTYRFGRCEYDKPGTAEGILIGGNLTVTKTVLNTGFDCTKIDQPYIILLEDVESNFLNVHLSFTMLKNNGVLDHAAGIILGEQTGFDLLSNDYDGRSRGGRFTSATDMIYRQFLKDLDIPVACRFPAGHGEKNYPVLLGAKVRLTVGEKDSTLEWLDTE